MRSVNKVILIGALGQDPKIVKTESGMLVANLSLATSRKNKDKTETTQWHNCVAFGKIAELIEQFCSKGTKIYIEGELQYQQYEKDGEKRFTTKIIINDTTFLGGGESDGYQGSPKQTPKPKKAPESAPENYDDEIPF